jgi:hypothetical protein
VTETVIGALIVAAITGPSLLAYRNPQAYAKLYPLLAGTLGAVLVMALAHYIGYLQGIVEAQVRLYLGVSFLCRLPCLTGLG